MLMISYNIVQKHKMDEILKICDIIRYNSAWFTVRELVDSLKEGVGRPRFVDIHTNRVKTKTSDHAPWDILPICNDLNVEWIGVSNVTSPKMIENFRAKLTNGKTKICAKIESREGVKNIVEIAAVADGIMVDKEDLATECGSSTDAVESANEVYRHCIKEDIPTFELYGVIFNYQENKKVKIVYTYGVWDLLHTGHIALLERAKALGDHLVVGVVGDEAVRELKGEDRPLQPLEERLAIVSCLKMIDRVMVQENYDPIPNLTQVNPDILTKGDDWDKIPGEEWCAEFGKEFVRLSYTKGVSTSETVKRLQSSQGK